MLGVIKMPFPFFSNKPKERVLMSIDETRKKYIQNEEEKLKQKRLLALTNEYQGKIANTDDWKQKIDLKQELEREVVNVDGRSVDIIITADEVALSKLQKEYYCEICRVKPTIPLTYRTDNDADYGDNSKTITTWNKPGDLFKCKICSKYFCGSHIYNEICQKCSGTL